MDQVQLSKTGVRMKTTVAPALPDHNSESSNKEKPLYIYEIKVGIEAKLSETKKEEILLNGGI